MPHPILEYLLQFQLLLSKQLPAHVPERHWKIDEVLGPVTLTGETEMEFLDLTSFWPRPDHCGLLGSKLTDGRLSLSHTHSLCCSTFKIYKSLKFKIKLRTIKFKKIKGNLRNFNGLLPDRPYPLGKKQLYRNQY